MDTKKYITESARTAAADYDKINGRVNAESIDLLHAAIGMATESAEFLDVLKKKLFYGKEIDKVNLIEELGDQMWYIAMAVRALGTDLETVMQINIDKLKARYPDKFTEEKAENRDLETERKVLEGEEFRYHTTQGVLLVDNKQPKDIISELEGKNPGYKCIGFTDEFNKIIFTLKKIK